MNTANTGKDVYRNNKKTSIKMSCHLLEIHSIQHTAAVNLNTQHELGCCSSKGQFLVREKKKAGSG